MIRDEPRPGDCPCDGAEDVPITTHLRRHALARTAERYLFPFVQQAWPIVEPVTPLVDSWHVGAICHHLEACSRGEIRKLLINVPPRCSKSLLVGVFWPAWTWIVRPHTRWLAASYAQHLATRDSLKCRDVIASPWYQSRWRDRFRLRDDQNQKVRFDNNRSGFRLATSTGGVGTGEGGDFIIADDPHNVTEIESPTQREAVLYWWDQSMSTRGNDPRTACHVVVMQRLHERDLAGHLLEQGGYEHLCLPMEYDPRRSCVTSLGWRDPRRTEGELLCPVRFGASEVAELKCRLGALGFAGQMQQAPQPREGALFERDFFRYFRDHETRFELLDAQGSRWFDKDECWWLQTVDTAQKTGQANDYTVVGTFATTPEGDWLVVDIWRDKVEVPRQFGALFEQRVLHQPHVTFQAVEDQQSGVGLLQEGKLRGLSFQAIRADGDKVRRASSVSLHYENGKVFHRLAAAWLADFEQELLAFPRGAHDDQVDVLAYAGRLITERAIREMQRKLSRSSVLCDPGREE